METSNTHNSLGQPVLFLFSGTVKKLRQTLAQWKYQYLILQDQHKKQISERLREREEIINENRNDDERFNR